MHPKSTVDRFWLRVRKSDSCWEWTGGKTASRYGLFYAGNGLPRGYAHRYSWELHNGPVPAGMFVCHHCDNPPCVRPDHLWIGTTTENMRDAAAKGRLVMPRTVLYGERTSNAKLTTDQVRAIRARHALGDSLGVLARVYEVHHITIWDIIHRRSWGHVA